MAAERNKRERKITGFTRASMSFSVTNSAGKTSLKLSRDRKGAPIMNSTSRRYLIISAIFLLPSLHAQKDTTFTADVNVVNVFATVRDKKGAIIRNLAKDDFTLEEDGRPQTIRYFSQESGLPLTLGLLVDTSLSQRRVLGQERTASYRFLSQVLREDKDLAFLIHFDREVELLQDLTSSRKELDKALGELELPEEQRGWAGRGGRRRGG